MISFRFFLTLIISATLSLIVVFSAYGYESIQNKITLNDKTENKVPINIEIYTTKFKSGLPYLTGFRWGTELKSPKILITNINISYGEKKIFVPLSAYCDLTNSTNYSIQSSKNVFSLFIYGGHASTSYKAELVFENGYIQRRKVHHQEFPNEAWEETIYSFNTGIK